MNVETQVRIPARDAMLEGSLIIPHQPRGIVLFVHGSGSSRHSPRNRFVAEALNAGGLATLLFDLLTREEESLDIRTAHLRFDIGLLARRLEAATDWVSKDPEAGRLSIGYFGSSTGGGAALVAAAARPGAISAVVSRGGRPDLAGPALASVRAPTLLVVGGEDDAVIDLNRQAMAKMKCDVTLRIVPGASHLFEEPGTLETVARFAREWFLTHFPEASP